MPYEFLEQTWREQAISHLINSTVAIGDHLVAVGGDVNALVMTGAQATYIAQLVQAPTPKPVILPPKLQAYLFKLYNLSVNLGVVGSL